MFWVWSGVGVYSVCEHGAEGGGEGRGDGWGGGGSLHVCVPV